MNQLYTALGLLLIALTGPAYAQDKDAAADLRQRLDTMNSLTGAFTQTLLDEEGELLEESQGNFAMARPGKFDWHTLEPFEQRLVSNRDNIWVYDPDLQQVTVRQVDERLRQTPAVILSEDMAALQETFQVTRQARQDLTFFVLTPKKNDDLFARLELGFEGDLLCEIRIHDNLDQVSIFKLEDLSRNGELDHSRFEFQVPEGVDVLAD